MDRHKNGLIEPPEPAAADLSTPGWPLVDCLAGDYLLEMQKDIRKGMSGEQKTIPSKYLYDAYGSLLFKKICCLPEYYPTRAELSILDSHAKDIMIFFRAESGNLIDIGCGSDLKIRKLLEAAPSSRLGSIRYVPVDISRAGLVQSTQPLLRDFPGLEVLGVMGDFTCHLEKLPPDRKLICFFGSTLGNFADREAHLLLRNFSGIMHPADRLVIGLDMMKDVEVIEAAYNDGSGVTARFNLNCLRNVNRSLGGDFRLDDFGHEAFFNPAKDQIEMHLRARKPTRAYIAGLHLPVSLAQGETIRTEISRKFSRRTAEELFLYSGLEVVQWYTDEKAWFSLVELKTREPLHSFQ